MLKCKRCGNEDPIYFAYKNGKHYCRRCILFNEDNVVYQFREDDEGDLNLDYELTSEQKNIAEQLIIQYKNKRNSLVHAVCGAGKTEIVYPLIEYVLRQGGRVGFAIPRKDVVIELYVRIKKAFPNNEVIALFGGNTKHKVGDITILTMHQIFRFSRYFDLLIADEIDAFPFKDNFVLNNLFHRSIKGNFVMMSATPSKEIIDKFDKKDCFLLEKRFHGYKIPIPEIVLKDDKTKKFFLLKKLLEYRSNNKPCLIFVSSIEKAESLYNFLSLFDIKGDFVHSKKDSKTAISNFKKGILDYLVSTSLLERGITIKSLQVIVFEADNKIFTKEVLEQIGGRVGRKQDDPYGEVIFLANSITEGMKLSIEAIEKHNENMFDLS